MHPSSSILMEKILTDCAAPEYKTLVDIGSYEGFAYRRIAKKLGMTYEGLDIRNGPNVDRVISESGDWGETKYDILISGQCLEHVSIPWIWIKQAYDIVRPGGLIVLIAPWKWRFHRHPVDCWRYLPDGMDSLLIWGGFRTIATGIPKDTNDCFGVGIRE